MGQDPPYLIRVTTQTHGMGDSRLAYGHMPGPGVYETTVSRPELYRDYLIEQISGQSSGLDPAADPAAEPAAEPAADPGR